MRDYNKDRLNPFSRWEVWAIIALFVIPLVGGVWLIGRNDDYSKPAPPALTATAAIETQSAEMVATLAAARTEVFETLKVQYGVLGITEVVATRNASLYATATASAP